MGCGRGIHDGGFRLYPGSDHGAAQSTGSDADARIAAYPFDLPRICEGIDIQHALLFSKPDWGLHGCPIPFDTLQVEILFTRKGGKALARHGTIFLLNAVGTFSCTIVPGMWISFVQQAAVAGDRYGGAH